MLQVTINGRSVPCASEQTVLSALRSAGVHVPALCDDPRLAPIGACRLCVVEVEGEARPVAACTTPLVEGMAIRTHTPALEECRRTLLLLLAQDYPAEAVSRDVDNPFHRLIRAYGLESDLQGAARAAQVDDSHPCIHVDMSQCIDCFRCVRICDEVAGQDVWRAWNRGDRTEIRPANRTNLRDSECVAAARASTRVRPVRWPTRVCWPLGRANTKSARSAPIAARDVKCTWACAMVESFPLAR